MASNGRNKTESSQVRSPSVGVRTDATCNNNKCELNSFFNTDSYHLMESDDDVVNNDARLLT